MSAVTIAQALKLEASAKTNGWSDEQLLDLAGNHLGHAIGRKFPHPGTAVAYLGKGHNAGDALVALRILRDDFGWEIAVRLSHPIANLVSLTQKKWHELGNCRVLETPPSWQISKSPLLLLDALLGSGSSGPMRSPLIALSQEMASLRKMAGARVAAIDLPSGIDPDTGEVFLNTVTADITFMIGNAKCGLLCSHAVRVTGALALIPVKPLTASHSSSLELISPQTLDFGKEPRVFDFHKGMAGRVSILAGSKTYSGAAVLAANGALRSGSGLVTLFVPKSIHSLVSSKCPPEIIVRGIEEPEEMRNFRSDAWVIGCGLGEMDAIFENGILNLIRDSQVPTVVDADALNLIARSSAIHIFSDMHVLTPHPGEFARLAPDLASLTREKGARQFADRHAATLLLKGARTLVTRRDQPLWCNATGTPAMATGGQGDLLSGVLGARLAIADSPLEASLLSAWICGRSAELALDQLQISEESLTPSDCVHFLGAAFGDWKTSSR